MRIVRASVSILALASLLIAFRVNARPGGGGGYRSGGGSSGSSSSSRSSGSYGRSSGGYSSGGSYGGYGTDPAAVLVFLLFGGAILIVYVVVQASSRNSKNTRSALLSAQFDAQAQARRSASLDPLRARDPALTDAAIVDRVTRMSAILQQAWCTGDMRPARAFVSDGVFSRFQVQLALMRTEGLRNVMGDARVLYTTIEVVSSEPPVETVHVRFTAQAKDAMVPFSSTAEQIDQALRAAPDEPYTEIWALVRKYGAKTSLSADRVGLACPSCGAPLDGGEVIRCRYCGALACSGEHDWVLAEITQISEWYPDAERPIEGLDALRQKDPGVAREALEDRGSYLFWKWIEAARTGSQVPLRKCTSSVLLQTGADLQGVASVRNVAVGGADLLLCDPGQNDMDYAYIKIFWSAEFQHGTAPTPVQSVFRLARKSGVTSKLSMTALVCQACGATLSESDSTRCDHCGAELAAGDQAWVLDGIVPAGSVRRRHETPEPNLPEWLVPNVTDPRERSVLFSQMASLMAQDGRIEKPERRFLRMCAERWNIQEEAVAYCLEHPAPTTHVFPSSPQWFLAGLVAAALADGMVDSTERAMLERACTSLSLPLEELERQITAYGQRLAAEDAHRSA